MSAPDQWPRSAQEARRWVDALKQEGRLTVSIERTEDLVACIEELTEALAEANARG